MIATTRVFPEIVGKRSLGFQRRLRRGEPRERDAEWRAGHVVETGVMAEPHGLRIAAVLAADADLEILALAAPALDRDLDELAHAGFVERREGIFGEDLPLEIIGQKPARVVAREAERHLCEVVR